MLYSRSLLATYFILFIILFILFYCLFVLFRAASVACRSSQARGLIRVVAAGLHHSHSNARYKPCLRPTYTTAHDSAGSLTH